MLAGTDNEPPLIFNRIAIGMKFDTERKRVLLTQADISNGEIGVAGTGSVDYAGEPRLQLGFAGTPMSASALKRMWPILIVPEVREWVIERIETRHAAAHRGRRQFAGAQPVAQGAADSG